MAKNYKFIEVKHVSQLDTVVNLAANEGWTVSFPPVLDSMGNVILVMERSAKVSIKKDAPFVPKWLEIAIGELGTEEVPGEDDNPRIQKYLQTTGMPSDIADETPWCSAFVNWVMKETDIRGTNSASARSWEQWGSPVNETYGSVVVLWRDDPQSWKGHVGFAVGWGNRTVYILGGNQGNKVSIKEFSTDRVRQYRWPDLI